MICIHWKKEYNWKKEWGQSLGNGMGLIVQDILSKTTTTTKHEQKNQNPKCKRVFIVY